MRRPLLERYDVYVLTIATVALLTLVVFTGGDLRRFSNALGVAATGLLLWRLFSTWDRLTVLEHALVMLLAAAPIAAGLASLSLQARTTDLPYNPWLWAVIMHRFGIIILVVFWNRWLGRQHSPFRRTPVHRHDDGTSTPPAG